MEDHNDNSKEFNYSLENTDSSSETTVTERIYTHRWTIKNFSDYITLAEKADLKIKSVVFEDESTTGLSWYLQTRVNDLKHEDSFGDSDFIFNVDLNATKIKASDVLITRVELKVLDGGDNPVKSTKKDTFFHKPGSETLHSLEVANVDDLLHNPNKFVVDNQMKIHLRVWVKSFSTQNFNNVRRNTEKNIRKDMQNLLSSSKHHDVIIVADSKEEFKAHKNILSARSSVFAAIFQSEATEANTDKVTISNFEDLIIQEMLKFIYSGEVTNLEENVVELLKISDLYDIKDLKEECVQRIPFILTCKNVIEILQAINAYSDQFDLKEKVIQFISQNKALLEQTPGFQNLEALVQQNCMMD